MLDKVTYSLATSIVHIVLLCGFLQKQLNVYIIFTDPTEKVTIQVLPQGSTIKEGDNITLKCSGNGNPPPQEFLFYIPVSPALLSPHSETFCITPSYRHGFYNKWRKEFHVTVDVSHYISLWECLMWVGKIFWKKPLLSPTPPEGFFGVDILTIARLHFPPSDILMRSSFD